MKIHNPFGKRKPTLAGAIADTCLTLLAVFVCLYTIHYVVNSFSPVAITGTLVLAMLGYAVIYYVYYIFTGKDLFGKTKETNRVPDVD